MGTDALAGRTQSAYPLSVGTSLCFETIFPTTAPSIDPDRKVPPPIDLNKYKEMWINISTLIRNIISSLPTDSALSVGSNEVADTILQEIEFIISLFKNEGQGLMKPVFYACEYDRIVSATAKPLIALRMDNTPLQKAFRAIHNQALKNVFDQFDPKDTTYRKFNNNIKPTNKLNGVLLLSHYAYDLTNASKFHHLDLIESHTGVLKDKFHFYTKYYNGSDLSMIPFIKGLLMIMGDKEHFRPLDLKLRREIVDIAKQYQWSQITTEAKAKYYLGNMKNHYAREIIMTIMNQG